MVVRFQSSAIPCPSMSVMTSNRKRSEECMNVNHTISSSPNSSDSYRKRPRFSNFTGPVLSSNSTVSRISRYPEAKPPLRREVHAPCRPKKFEFLTSPRTESSFKARLSCDFQKEEIGFDMGNVLDRTYQTAKRIAIASRRFFPREKEVIDVDNDSHRYQASEDSSIEEVRIVEDGGCEGRSVLTDQKWQGNAEVVVEIHDLDAKVEDGGIQQQSTSSLDSELTNSNLKVVNAGKTWESLALSHERDLSKGVHAYKKLLEAAGIRDSRTDKLKYEIKLNEKRREALTLLHLKKEPVEKVPHEPFVPLTKEEENEVGRAFSVKRNKILVTHEDSNIEITAEKFKCLRPGAWLNDEVINLYLELLKEREKREPQKFLKCHFFNTFFYKKLISGRNGYDFKSVRRWTSQRKLGYGLVECDKIFIPIHKEIHWCLAIINKKDKKLQYLDSLKGMDNQVLKVLARYFVDEVKDKTGKDIDVSSWEKEFVEDLPEQENGFDCGMFMIKYADFYSRGLGLCFKQEHMPYFRVRTAKEILRLKAD